MISAENICYEKYQEELVALRRHFHQYPEISEQEYETAAYIENYLKELGLQPERVAKTGVVVMIWAPDEIRDTCETVAVRAETDAVFVEEKNDFTWKSKKTGVMHACGHDAIIACGLVLAKLCAENRNLLPVNVKLLFQPAEENGQGTRLFLEAGVMENPHVDRFVMFHFANDFQPGVEFKRGPSSAAIGSLILTIHGKASHMGNAAYGIDSILAASKVVDMIHRVNLEFQSDVPHVVGIGMIHGGKAKNVVAEQTILQGTIRSCSLSEYQRLRLLVIEELKKIEQETGTRIQIEIDENPIPPIVNHEEMVDLGLRAGKKVWGSECRLVNQLYLSGDSAAYYFNYAKGVFMVFTARKEHVENFPLHSGHFDFEEAALWKAAETLHRFVLECGNYEEK